jgi:hypothetical protein
LFRITIISDVHYAGAGERAYGNDYELRSISNPVTRSLLHLYRHYVWLRNPLDQGYLLDKFLSQAPETDLVVANGDYSCDCASVGLSDDVTLQSVQECLGKLRAKYSKELRLVIGDHELGKVSFIGSRGGMRIESWRRLEKVGLQPFWRFDIGNYTLFGIASSLVALPIFEPDTLPYERIEWERLRGQHMEQIRDAFASLKAEQRVILFAHDPTALPFLYDDEVIRGKVPQIEQTLLGHLHSNLVLWKSKVLAGFPEIRFMGHTAQRFSRALRQARRWRHFNVRLCPALAGIELLKDGGYLTATIDPQGRKPTRFEFKRVGRSTSGSAAD